MKPKIYKVVTRDNNFQHVEVLKRNREKRTRYRKCFVEGVRPISLALENGWEFDMLIYCRDGQLSEWAEDVVTRSRAELHLDVSRQLLAELSDKETPSELLAIVKRKEVTLASLKYHESGLLVLCDRPASPGNLGTTVRSADAFKADAVILSGHGVDPYESEAIRASVGTAFSVPLITISSPQTILEWTRRSGGAGQPYKIVATSAHGQRPLFATDLVGPMVVLLGNETLGLSRAFREMADETVSIPMYGQASSLNVSCAASILLYEVRRQRAAASERILNA